MDPTPWQLDAERLLKLAQQLEMAGELFYRRMADCDVTEAVRETFLALANDEAEHERTFRRMRQRAAAGDRIAAGDQASALAEIVDGMKQADTLAALDCTTGAASPRELLGKAVEMEQQSVAFYARLSLAVADQAAKQALDAIIAEEQSHVDQLNQRLAD